jgi:hypothetical protein
MNQTNNNTQNPNNNLKSQINSLASEIKVLENSQTNQNLLNAKKAELEELKKQVSQQNNQIKSNSNFKLYLGIGLGILGGGIIGIVLWLVLRKRDK